MPLSPKWRFRVNRLQNRWEAWKGNFRQTKQAVTAEQKMCPSCRALVSRGSANCPYCGQRLKVLAATPAGRIASRAMPGLPVAGWLILGNFILFVMEYAVGGNSPLTNLMAAPTQAAVLRLGVSLPIGYIVASHQYWRWVTACFLHGGLIHIGFNMWALYDIGPMVESYYGGSKFLTFYLLTGICGYIASSFGNVESLGASGAIFGLLGVMIAYGVRRRHTAAGQHLRGVALRWAFYALALTFLMPGIDNHAHIGGLVSGFLLGMVIGDDPPLSDAEIARWNLIRWAMIVVLVASFAFMAVAPPLA